ncbi:SLC13 family permease, partial [Desulfovibrio sp.]|uniref:SLC13 family permease n=1 Tax=Desulfovibrio sp. TaxID=885 RepID=UPI0023D4547E
MRVIGVFAGVIYGWIMIDIGWPSILGLVALCLTGYMPTGNLLATAFGSQTIVMILALLFLAAFVQQAELTEVIVDFLLSRKATVGKPFLILFNFLLAGFLAAVLSQCLAVLVIFLEIFKEIVRKTGLKPYSTAIPTFMVGMAFAIVIGDISLPFKGCAILGIGAYEAITGQTMNLASFTVFMFPMCLATIAFYVLVCKYIFRVDLSLLRNYRHEPSRGAVVTPFKKISLIAIIVSLALLLLPGIIPKDWAISGFFSQLGLGGLSMAILAVLMIIRVNGEALLDMTKVANFFPWKVFFVLVV